MAADKYPKLVTQHASSGVDAYWFWTGGDGDEAHVLHEPLFALLPGKATGGEMRYDSYQGAMDALVAAKKELCKRAKQVSP